MPDIKETKEIKEIKEIYKYAQNGVTTDSRGDVAGKLFIPLVGENFDGHNYIEEALKKGAVRALTEKEPQGKQQDNQDKQSNQGNQSNQDKLIKVKSTRQTLQDLAAHSRDQFTGPVVAITGSAGKTTTKDIISSVLSQKYKTLKTIGNFNNDIGLPLTLLSKEPDHEAVVLEMGMNHRGEISILSKIGKPSICLITNIGDAHIENLGSRQGILSAKSEIFEGMQEGGTVILNGDDPLLSALPKIPHAGKTIYCYNENTIAPIQIEHDFINPGDMVIRDSKGKAVTYRNQSQGEIISVHSYGPENPPDGDGNWVSASMIARRGLRGTSCNISWRIEGILGWSEGTMNVDIPLPGDHMIMNALMAYAVGIELGLTPLEIYVGIKEFSPSNNRMAIIEAMGMTIINDAYNASPPSMKATIKMLSDTPYTTNTANSRKVCILGDMFELGEFSKDMHKDVGQYAAGQNIDLLITIGEASSYMHEEFKKNSKGSNHSVHFRDKQDFISQWQQHLRPGDIILIKASRGMALESIAENFK